MNEHDIDEAMNGIREEHILDSRPNEGKNRSALKWVGTFAAAAAAMLGAIVLLSSLKEGKSPTVDAAAPTDAVQTETAAPAFTAAPALTFPTEGPLAAQLADKQLSDTGKRLAASALKMARTPLLPSEGSSEYAEYLAELRLTKYGRGAHLGGFYQKTLNEFLSGSQENGAFSPFCAYTALAMLAEVTGGETRAQILDLLGVPDIGTLRQMTAGLTDSNYRDGERETILSAASFWMNDLLPAESFKSEALDALAEYHRASSFTGTMGSPEYDALMRDWINENTNGLLSEQVKEMESDPSVMMRLMTTLYFKAGWTGGRQDAAKLLFHSVNGDRETDFIVGSGADYFDGDGFTMASKDLYGGNKMWFILPDEGVTIDSLLENDAALDAILTGNGGKGFEGHYRVSVRVPMFDSESKINLINGLKHLGVTDCFDADAADFSPLSDEEGICVSEADHGVRVIMDRDGVEAAAFTNIGITYGGALDPVKLYTFTADRPFIYLIMSDDGAPLFAGTMYTAE